MSLPQCMAYSSLNLLIPKRLHMKTQNNHHLYYNLPLRLSPAQTQNPNLVLDDFFEYYHLNEVREIMWQWLTEVVSSPRDSANDPHERNNHMFFYEKMESLVEAAWILNRGTGQFSNPKSQANKKADNKPVQTTEKAVQPTRFSKPARLIEKATSHPVEVIAEVFDQTSLSDLTDYLLPNWLRVAVINTQSPYSHGNGRETLYEFYEQLISFVTQLYITSENQQLINPSTLFTDFFQQCPIDYIRRELADFLEAGIGYEGSYPNGFSPWQAWMTYNHLLCLTEAAYQRYINHQMQSVTNVLTPNMEEMEEVG
jgi:hypothetical protein